MEAPEGHRAGRQDQTRGLQDLRLDVRLLRHLPHSIGHRMRRAQGGSNAFPNLLPFLGLGNGLMGDDLDHHHRIDSRIDPHDHAAGWQLDRCQDPARESFLLVSEYGSGQQTWILGSGDLAFENPYEVEAA